MFCAPAYVNEERTPAMISSRRSSTPGRAGFKNIREVEMPSSNKALRARSNASSFDVRAATARADAIPKDSLKRRPVASLCKSPGDSYVPANHEPIMTCDAPAASASATSRG